MSGKGRAFGGNHKVDFLHTKFRVSLDSQGLTSDGQADTLCPGPADAPGIRMHRWESSESRRVEAEYLDEVACENKT